MKYWVFDGRDAQGPYEADELANLPLFGPETMICPEGTQSPEQWRAAKFYLVRPPGRPAPEIQRPQPRQRPTAVEEAVAEPEAPPAARPAPKPAPREYTLPKFNIPPAAAAAAGIILVALFGWWLARPKPKPAEPAAAVTAVPALDPQADAAVALLKSYPMAANKQRLPAGALEALSPARWSPAVNLGDFYERRALLALSQDALQTVTRQGRRREEGEKEINRDSARWERYSQSFLAKHFSQNWTAESAGPGRYTVSALLRYHEGVPEQKRRFEVTPAERKLRPLDIDSWFDIDPKAASAWAARNLYLGSMADESAITLRAPDYLWDALKAAAASPRPISGKPPKGTAAAVRRAMAPPPDEDEYESVSPEEIERADTGGRAAAAAPAAAAKAKPASQVPQMKLPSDAELGARAAPAKPAAAPKAAEPPLQPPSGQGAPESARATGSDATKMSVDELEKYLGRGKKADAPDKAAPAKPAGDDLWEQ